ncbi:MAG: DUF4339 domain-containing protein [Pirellulales bacterium]|nr:DUF4339 domain-containing protein [Pirellulales bacterium]
MEIITLPVRVRQESRNFFNGSRSSRRGVAMRDWFYLNDFGDELGPFTADELKGLAAAGTLNADTIIRRGSTNKRAKASQVKGLWPNGAPPASTCDPSEVEDARSWHFQQASGREIGPLTRVELRELIDQGIVTPDTLVRLEPDDRWLPGALMRELFPPVPKTATTSASPQEAPARHADEDERRWMWAIAIVSLAMPCVGVLFAILRALNGRWETAAKLFLLSIAGWFFWWYVFFVAGALAKYH